MSVGKRTGGPSGRLPLAGPAGKLRRGLLLLSAVLLLGAAANADDHLTNIAGAKYGTRIAADTSYGQQYLGPEVADGEVVGGASCWFSADQTKLPCALTFEFAGPADIRQIVLYQASWVASMYHSKDVAVEVSDDGQTWRRIASATLPDQSEARVEVPFEPVTASRLRLVVLSSYIELQTCGFAEVEVMAAGMAYVTPMTFTLNGQAGPPPSDDDCGVRLIAGASGPQVAVMAPSRLIAVDVAKGETAGMTFAAGGVPEHAEMVARAYVLEGDAAEICVEGPAGEQTVPLGRERQEVRLPCGSGEIEAALEIRSPEGATVVIEGVSIRSDALTLQVLLATEASPAPLPPPEMPSLRPGMERLLIEWDWRMQDGIGTERNPVSFADAISRAIERGDRLVADLREAGLRLGDELSEWRAACGAWEAGAVTEEDAWRRLHWAKRALSFSNPLANTGPILFAKNVPGAFSHQLTQVYGRYARPGGGLFVLERPGESMRSRQLAPGSLPLGSFMTPELSYDADRIVFAFCEADTPPADTIRGEAGRYYHLYDMAADGSDLRRLTEGPFDDFSPRYLPDGRLILISTRRLGWHRCGNPGCENYTLAIANADGSDPHTVSYHETQEWDPAVLNDGRIVYTRWDYVDRHAIFYEQLWSVEPGGASPAAFYGNNTFNPVGIWEARAIPGSRRVMATAAAHHAMTAGSVILVDPAMGVDGPQPITRLTPDAPFPESESLLAPSWRAPLPDLPPYDTPEQQRWPGHCYKSPYPLSERYFLAAYSFQGLVGEPKANEPNMFGLYLVDAFGNKELLYRDLNIASVWPTPMRARPRPPVVKTLVADAPTSGPKSGVYLIEDVRESSQTLPEERIAAIRIVQVLPKSTPGANNPMVGSAFASPGKQVLGTVPVEQDGSAYFEAPAGVPLSFQALDSHGRAVQVMRSVSYLQPGQTLACVGCHEHRETAPRNRDLLALRREPSTIQPGPDGASPLSYPILVQPVLDRSCVSCHGGDEPAGGIRLTGEPDGHFTVSYNALAPRVSIAQWTSSGDFRLTNSEPLAQPDFFGARGSALMRMLDAGHHEVALSDDGLDRLVTWMDANALFYGTFDYEAQARQQLGERIDGPALE